MTCRFGNTGPDFESRVLGTGLPPVGCLFATAPDVVCDMAATWARSEPWLATVHRLGFPVALVGQNGLEAFAPAWDEADSWDWLFIGGDDTWKDSQDAADCAHEGQPAAGTEPWSDDELGEMFLQLAGDQVLRGRASGGSGGWGSQHERPVVAAESE